MDIKKIFSIAMLSCGSICAVQVAEGAEINGDLTINLEVDGNTFSFFSDDKSTNRIVSSHANGNAEMILEASSFTFRGPRNAVYMQVGKSNTALSTNLNVSSGITCGGKMQVDGGLQVGGGLQLGGDLQVDGGASIYQSLTIYCNPVLGQLRAISFFEGSNGNTISSGSDGGYATLRLEASSFTFVGAKNKTILSLSSGTSKLSSNLTVDGTITCRDKLRVADLLKAGQIETKDIRVEMNEAADYVFDENYDLRPLDEVERFVKENKHLPGVPSAAEMSQEGMSVSQMSNLLLEKIEELTLHMIDMKKEINSLKEENASLRSQLEAK